MIWAIIIDNKASLAKRIISSLLIFLNSNKFRGSKIMENKADDFVSNPNPIIIPNKNKIVSGFIIEISNDELKKIDEYEGVEYKRVEIVLQSGISAWVYLKT